VNKTKIVCTIGPATESADALRQLHKAGLSVARLNGSHNTLDWHAETIARIRDVLPEIPILLDIPGRKIRTLQLEYEPTFEIGDAIVLTTDQSANGRDRVPVGHPTLHEQLKIGAVILADDGTLRFTVTEISGQDVHCKAETAGTLKSQKGINVPGMNLVSEMVTDKDRQMVQFARDNGVDFIGVSFVEGAEQVDAIRELAGGSWPRIVAKVENQGGLDHLDEIIAAADALMIDRGDLSAETNLEKVALMQKHILARARESGLPVIVATEMLHSMIGNPFPTKAEVSDITNAVIDGGSATMLSGETAMGKFPMESTSVMRAIAAAAEDHIQVELDVGGTEELLAGPQAMERAVVMLCRSLPITKIVAVTLSGFAARVIAAHRPRQPILAVCNDENVARSFNLYAGVEGVYIDMAFSRTSADHVVECLKELLMRDKLVPEDMIVVISVGYPKSGNRMNLLQTHVVGDLIETMSWSQSN
jgi:pyruvate kinase